MIATRETIFAVATALGRAGIAVVRVSGSQAALAVERLTRRKAPAERRAVYRELFDNSNNSLIDAGLVLFFAAPRSYTGEDSAEFHIHGGRDVAGSLLRVLAQLPGLRLAEPGDFTRRGVDNGRLGP